MIGKKKKKKKEADQRFTAQPGWNLTVYKGTQEKKEVPVERRALVAESDSNCPNPVYCPRPAGIPVPANNLPLLFERF